MPPKRSKWRCFCEATARETEKRGTTAAANEGRTIRRVELRPWAATGRSQSWPIPGRGPRNHLCRLGSSAPDRPRRGRRFALVGVWAKSGDLIGGAWTNVVAEGSVHPPPCEMQNNRRARIGHRRRYGRYPRHTNPLERDRCRKAGRTAAIVSARNMRAAGAPPSRCRTRSARKTSPARFRTMTSTAGRSQPDAWKRDLTAGWSRAAGLSPTGIFHRLCRRRGEAKTASSAYGKANSRRHGNGAKATVMNAGDRCSCRKACRRRACRKPRMCDQGQYQRAR